MNFTQVSLLHATAHRLVRIPLILLLASVMSVAGASLQKDGDKQKEPPSTYCGGPVCSGVYADKTELVLGETADLHANASEPTGLELTYVWKTTGGSVVGEGANVTYFAPTDTPGRYEVTVFVTDKHGHKVYCGIAITVSARGKPSPTIQTASNKRVQRSARS